MIPIELNHDKTSCRKNTVQMRLGPGEPHFKQNSILIKELIQQKLGLVKCLSKSNLVQSKLDSKKANP